VDPATYSRGTGAEAHTGAMNGSSRGFGIVNRVQEAKEKFGPDYPKKFGGAYAIEILRDELDHEGGIETSGRDVYVRGVHSEIDLLVLRPNAKPLSNLLYEPHEVAVVLEVKKTGSFGKQGRDKIEADFKQFKTTGVKCAYVTFQEGRNYKWRPTEEIIGAPVFTLAWHDAWGGELKPAGVNENWEAFVQFLRKEIAGTG
jgi:hypothetical protein